MASSANGGPFLQLVKRCDCGRQLAIRPSIAWVNWMRRTTKHTGDEFDGAAFSHYCSGCRRIVHVDAEDLYLGGVLERETGG